MWPLILNYLKPGAKNVAVAEGAVILFVCLYAWNQHEQISLQKKDLETAQVALQHPKVVETVKYVRVTGPTRIITRIVEKPSGEKETTIDSTTSGTQTAVGADEQRTPVPVATIQPVLPKRDDRYLLGFSNRNLGLGRLEAYGVWAGYSWANRVDFLVGGTYDDHVSSLEGTALVVLRF